MGKAIFTRLEFVYIKNFAYIYCWWCWSCGFGGLSCTDDFILILIIGYVSVSRRNIKLDGEVYFVVVCYDQDTKTGPDFKLGSLIYLGVLSTWSGDAAGNAIVAIQNILISISRNFHWKRMVFRDIANLKISWSLVCASLKTALNHTPWINVYLEYVFERFVSLLALFGLNRASVLSLRLVALLASRQTSRSLKYDFCKY